MKLKCEINNKKFDIVNGATFSEEYNETLDSASIIITGVERQPDLRSFDDVFIYNADDEFNGYASRKSEILIVNSQTNGTTIIIDKEELKKALERDIESYKVVLIYVSNNIEYEERCTIRNNNGVYQLRFGEVLPIVWYPLIETGAGFLFNISSFADAGYFKTFEYVVNAENITMPSFYRHFLIDNFTEERINPIENLYKYKISLFSEIKKLERIPLPNISITQPLDISLRKTVADYIKQYVDMYSPTIKVATSKNTFVYVKKYVVDDSIDDIFGDAYCPDFTLDNPSLRTLLSQLFLVKDRIPYVKDDVIYALDVTERKGNFDGSNLNLITGSRSSENYSTGLKRSYKNALSGKNTARKVEYIGFRNSDSALLTLENMRVETKFPIYKINKIYMCYYKKAQIWTGEGEDATYTGEDKVYLCKQDITKLIKLDEEQAVLSKDWNDFTNSPPADIDEMAQYKLCTLSYSIGSNKIEGWGTSYEYPLGWWGDNTITKTYIENIFNLLEQFTPYGIYTVGYLSKTLQDNQFISINQSVSHRLDNIVSPIPISDGAKRLKSFFFMVDYEAFYNGTVLTSKDNENRDDIVSNDNQSASLTLLEKDGLFQKEKANRFGNMAYTYYGTYDDISELQELGSVDNSLDEDVIIYHREYQIYENYVIASYFGSKDYVLKNYFTTVYAKHRPFNLLPYSQSVIRAENRKVYLMLSKNELYYEQINSDINVEQPLFFDKFNSYIASLISFAKPNPKPESIGKFSFPEKINYGYLTHNNKKYSNDINIFTNGYSLCMNISMWDNISMGNYIKVLNPQMNSSSVEDDLTGSVQSFYPMIDNTKTGFTETIGFYFSHTPEETFSDIVLDYTSGIENTLYNKLLELPLLSNSIEETNIVGKEYSIHKDNKEVIDMTFQIEPYTNDEDVLFSEWLLKLCDLYGVYNKFNETFTIKDVGSYIANADVYLGTVYDRVGESLVHYRPMMCMKIPVGVYNSLQVGSLVNFNYAWSVSHYMPERQFLWEWVVIGIEVTFTEITEVTADDIYFRCRGVRTVKKGFFDFTFEKQPFEKICRLTKVNSIGGISFANDTDNYYFSNIVSGNGLFFDIAFESNGFYGDNHTSIAINTTEWTSANHGTTFMQIGLPSGVTATYYKNLFLKFNDTKLKKTLVYNEYKFGDYPLTTLADVTNMFSIEQEQEQNINSLEPKVYIKVNLASVGIYRKSIELWYNERENDTIENSGTLHFVFGINITQEDIQRGYVKIYASLLTKKDTRVFGTNNKIVGKIVNYEDEDNNKNYGEKQYYVLE